MLNAFRRREEHSICAYIDFVTILQMPRKFIFIVISQSDDETTKFTQTEEDLVREIQELKLQINNVTQEKNQYRTQLKTVEDKKNELNEQLNDTVENMKKL